MCLQKARSSPCKRTAIVCINSSMLSNKNLYRGHILNWVLINSNQEGRVKNFQCGYSSECATLLSCCILLYWCLLWWPFSHSIMYMAHAYVVEYAAIWSTGHHAQIFYYIIKLLPLFITARTVIASFTVPITLYTSAFYILSISLNDSIYVAVCYQSNRAPHQWLMCTTVWQFSCTL